MQGKTAGSLRKGLLRHLLPLAWGLLAAVLLLIAMTWGVLQVQKVQAGFLSAESVWSKAQKQAVIDLDAYARHGATADLASFHRHYTVLASDRWAREAVIAGNYPVAEVDAVFARGNIMREAQPGMEFALRHFSGVPHMREALAAWRATDADIDTLARLAEEAEAAWAQGPPPADEIAVWQAEVAALNARVTPHTRVFALEVVRGALAAGELMFWGVLATFLAAIVLWLRLARRTLGDMRGSEERYRLLFDSATDAIVMVDEASERVIDANRLACAWTGQAIEGLIGRRYGELFAFRPGPGELGRPALFRKPGGATLPVEIRANFAQWGERTVRQAFIRDISERVAMDRERRIAAEALAGIAEGVVIADANRRVVQSNIAMATLGGYPGETLQGMRFDLLRSLPDGSPLPEAVWEETRHGRCWAGEVSGLRGDGSRYPEHLSVSAILGADGAVEHYVAVCSDMREAKAHQARLEQLARHDALTGLVNRAEFERRAAAALAEAGREHLAVAVLFIDLDAFKIVNDSYSHATGDRLLVEVAARIRHQLSAVDVAGRIGGDEFTVLLPRLPLREDARVVAQRLLASLAEPILVDEAEIELSASIGIAGYPLDGSDPTALIANADAAMYVAKSEERNTFRFYTPMMHTRVNRRLQLAAELRQALVHDEFRLVFQPSVELATGRTVGVEALLRWQHPERGVVLPGEFIPLAEDLGLIRRIDEWVMQAVCAQVTAWDAAGVPPIRVAMNVSARWFGHAAFLERVERLLGVHGVPAGRLLLEITEGAMLRQGEDLKRTMRALDELGVRVAIDDFGTGYSSMAYLKLPAVHWLKIDRSFVAGLPDDDNDVAIIRAILAMAASLGLTPIAEGIELEAQHEFLQQAGCAEGQGHLYAHPLKPADVERLLAPNRPPLPPHLKLVPPRRA